MSLIVQPALYNFVCVALRLEAQPALAGRIGQGFHPAMKKVCAAIEHDFGHTGLLGALGQGLANFAGSSLVCTIIDLEILLERRGSGKRYPVHIVDDLRIDVLFRTEDRQARTAIGTCLDGLANTRLAAFNT